MRKIILFVLMMAFSVQCSGLMFPIPEQYVIKGANGNALLTGCFDEMRGAVKHGGLDIPAPLNTPVLAIKDGVILAHDNEKYNGKQAFGNYVAIRGADGGVTYYAHLQSYNVLIDQVVLAGDEIGKVGATGLDSDRFHLHLEERMNGKKIKITNKFDRWFTFIPKYRHKEVQDLNVSN